MDNLTLNHSFLFVKLNDVSSVGAEFTRSNRTYPYIFLSRMKNKFIVKTFRTDKSDCTFSEMH